MGRPEPPGEFGLIAAIRARAARHGSVPVGIGDDCAVLHAGPSLLVTKDMLLEGRHFLRRDATDAEIGYKCLAVNLSDIAAMAGRPLAAFVAVALPIGEAETIGRGLLDGMLPLADRFGVALAGGDTNAWEGPLVVSVTLVGEADGDGPVLRSGARPGDIIFVTGPLGGSLLGRHLRPLPRIDEARAIRALVPIHAMIDLSDGLSSDLGHILDESGGLGVIVDADRVPIHADAEAMAGRDGRSPLDHALNDGEDFELCFTLDPESASRLEARPIAGIAPQRIGTVTESGRWLRSGDGSLLPLACGGFDHFRGV